MGSGGVGLARSTSLLTGPIFTLRKICYANFYKTVDNWETSMLIIPYPTTSCLLNGLTPFHTCSQVDMKRYTVSNLADRDTCSLTKFSVLVLFKFSSTSFFTGNFPSCLSEAVCFFLFWYWALFLLLCSSGRILLSKVKVNMDRGVPIVTSLFINN